MIAHRNEEIEEQLPTFFHLHLHGATSLESVSAADDESQVMSSQLGVGIRCLGVGMTSRGEDGANLDARLKTLFAERKTAKVGEVISDGRTTRSKISIVSCPVAGSENKRSRGAD